MPRKNKNAFGGLIDSFISSVNRTGGSTSWLTPCIFFFGGAFGTYVGYTGPSFILMFGGALSVLIGFMMFYKVWHASFNRRGRRSGG